MLTQGLVVHPRNASGLVSEMSLKETTVISGRLGVGELGDIQKHEQEGSRLTLSHCWSLTVL